MDIKISNVLSKELTKPFLRLTSSLQKFLSEEFKTFDPGAGVELFMAVFVAVDDDAQVNAKFAKRHDQCSRFKGLDGRWIKAVEVAISLRPSDVMVALGDEFVFKSMLLDAFATRLDLPINKMPAEFMRDEFLRKLREAISKFAADAAK